MSKCLHVLRVTPHFYRQNKWPVHYDPIGGLQVQVLRLTMELSKSGISQTVLTSFLPGFPRSTTLQKSIFLECVGPSIPKFAAASLSNLGWFLGVLKHVVRKHSDYDVIHIHYNHSFWCRILSIIFSKFNIPVIVSFNTDLWVANRYEFLVKNRSYNLTRWIEKHALNASDFVIALTKKDAKRCVKEFAVTSKQIRVIADAIDLDKFTQPIDTELILAFNNKYSIPKLKPVILYVGRIRREKGWQDLPYFANHIHRSNAFLLICGDGPSRTDLEQALRNVNCPESWRITGFLDQEDIKVALHRADVLVLPSRRETFGSVLLEAMAMGVPAIAYNVGGIIEVAGKPNAIKLVAQNDLDGFTHAIDSLLNNKHEKNALVSYAHRRVQNFSLHDAAKDILHVYQNLCSARSKQKTKNQPVE